jgi:hypothetical protein
MSYFTIFFLLTFLILSSLNEISLVNKIKPTKVFKTILEIIEPTIASYEIYSMNTFGMATHFMPLQNRGNKYG